MSPPPAQNTHTLLCPPALLSGAQNPCFYAGGRSGNMPSLLQSNISSFPNALKKCDHREIFLNCRHFSHKFLSRPCCLLPLAYYLELAEDKINE